MPEVQIGPSSGCLALARDEETGPPGRLVASLRLDGLTASSQVAAHYASGFDDLAAFFASLADHWRGWAGARSWESLEHDLLLEARHVRGHVRLTVTLRNDEPGWGEDGWQVVGDVVLEPGEQLTRAARDVGALGAG